MTIRKTLPGKVTREVGSQWRSQEAEDFEKLEKKSGTQPDGSSHLIGNQLMGKAQIKHATILHGSHISLGNEVIFIDPYQGIHGDENNVCL